MAAKIALLESRPRPKTVEQVVAELIAVGDLTITTQRYKDRAGSFFWVQMKPHKQAPLWWFGTSECDLLEALNIVRRTAVSKGFIKEST